MNAAARAVVRTVLYEGGKVFGIYDGYRGLLDEHIEELSSLAALVEGSDCGVTLRELRPGVIKISLRTGPRVDASAVCQRLGGGGHRAAAGATVDGTMDEVRQAVLQAYQAVVG